MKLDRSAVNDLSKLAALELREGELDDAAVALSEILSWVETLPVIPADPDAGDETAVALDADEPGDLLAQGDVMRRAPVAEDGFIVVPPVLGGDDA